MIPTVEQLTGLNVALNEAKFLGLDFELARRRASMRLTILTLAEEPTAQSHMEVELSLYPVGRVAARLAGPDGQVTAFNLEELSEVVTSHAGGVIYGWEFFDPPSENIATWLDQASVDSGHGTVGLTHVLHVFQDTERSKLDVCLWFDELDVRTGAGNGSLDGVIAAGKRWWDAVFAGDARASSSHIHPIKKE